MHLHKYDTDVYGDKTVYSCQHCGWEQVELPVEEGLSVTA